jgi:hypothetical protein
VLGTYNKIEHSRRANSCYTLVVVLAYNEPPPTHRSLSLAVQTAYARLVDLLVTAEAGSTVDGSIVSKLIRGRRYWYVQRQEGTKKVQAYLGPDNDEVRAIVERWRRGRQEASTRAELVAIARAGGAHAMSAAEAQVLARLAGVFRLGAVLVGSHAFAVLGNLLGARWQDTIVRTEDVDIAHDHRIALALARDVEVVDIETALDHPIPRRSLLDPNDPATSFQVRGTEIQVELLTPMVGRERTRPVRIPVLGAAATPLRFLDYLIEETQPGAVVGGQGVLVNVPRPGRFALHKLIVAARRTARTGVTKSPKDIAQAAALLRLLAAELPGELTLAWKALSTRGAGWIREARRSAARLDPGLLTSLEAINVPLRQR